MHSQPTKLISQHHGDSLFVHLTYLNVEGVSKCTPSFFLRTKPRLSQAGVLLLLKYFVTLSIILLIWQKIHFRSYTPNQTVLFTEKSMRILQKNNSVRMVDALADSLNIKNQEII